MKAEDLPNNLVKSTSNLKQFPVYSLKLIDASMVTEQKSSFALIR